MSGLDAGIGAGSAIGTVAVAGSGLGGDWPMIDAFTTPQVYDPPPMPDNPQPAPGHEFALPGHAVLAIAGRDAVAFAQAQCMNDVAALGDGQWQWNGWLTPKGRVVALFALLRHDADTLWMLLPDASAATLAADLQRFVFRSKVTLTPLAMPVAGCFDAPRQAQGSTFAKAGDGGIELDMGGDGGPRTLRIGPMPARVDADALACWKAADLAHGLPRLDATQSSQWTPQQLSLERLQAFSVKKGCYPGQEIVARTHFLGQAKRGLVLLEAASPLAPGDEISDGQRAIGQVIAVAGTLAQGVASAETPLEAGGVPVKALDFAG